MDIAKASIIRLARRAGVKSISEECFPLIKALIVQRLQYILDKSLIINNEHGTKILMPNDIYQALSVIGENLTASTDLGTTTFNK
jgi:histone H3/H4